MHLDRFPWEFLRHLKLQTKISSIMSLLQSAYIVIESSDYHLKNEWKGNSIHLDGLFVRHRSVVHNQWVKSLPKRE